MPAELCMYRADAKFDWADISIVPMGYTEGQIAFSDGFIEGYWRAREYHSIRTTLKRLFKRMFT